MVLYPKQGKNKTNQQIMRNMKQNKIIWFDKECNNLKLEVRKLGRHKGTYPPNDCYYVNVLEKNVRKILK